MTVDARGEQCPIPVVRTKRALKEAAVGEVVTTLVDNEIAVQNLLKMAGQMGLKSESEKLGEKHYSVKIWKSADSGVAELAGEPGQRGIQGQAAALVQRNEAENEAGAGQKDAVEGLPDERQEAREKTGTVVALGSDYMGAGSEELGRVLMKGFIYALSGLDVLPDTVLLYNSGAKLSTEGSESVEDLKNLEAQGVRILTCGTCINFYGLPERPAVGTVTNMYSIVETMMQAEKLVRP